jgi:hypothetical protein
MIARCVEFFFMIRALVCDVRTPITVFCGEWRKFENICPDSLQGGHTTDVSLRKGRRMRLRILRRGFTCHVPCNHNFCSCPEICSTFRLGSHLIKQSLDEVSEKPNLAVRVAGFLQHIVQQSLQEGAPSLIHHRCHFPEALLELPQNCEF